MNREQFISLVEQGIGSEFRGKLKSEVRSHVAKLARVRLAEGRKNGVGPENHKEDSEITFNFCNRITSLLRRSCYMYRSLQLDRNLFWLLRHTLYMRANDWLTAAIVRHAPLKDQATLNVKDWVEFLSAEELKAIDDDFRFERISHSDADIAYCQVTAVVAGLCSLQLTFVASTAESDPGLDLKRDLFDIFLFYLQNSQFDMKGAFNRFGDVLQHAVSKTGIESTRAMTNAKLPGWIVMHAAPWAEARAQLCERLPLEMQGDPLSVPNDAPESWNWLCEDVGSILVCWGRFQVAQPRVYAEYRCRQISAICDCLSPRWRAEIYDAPPMIASTIICKTINVCLDTPTAFGKPPFDKLHLDTSGYARLSIPRWPFDNAAHIQELEELGLREILSWIFEVGENSQIAMALDAFENARSLGGRYGSLPSEVEEGWKIAALCTCLERLFCKRSIVGPDRRRIILENVRKIAGDRAADVTTRAFDRRNDQVHENLSLEWDDFPDFVAAVRNILQVKLCEAAGVKVK